MSSICSCQMIEITEEYLQAIQALVHFWIWRQNTEGEAGRQKAKRDHLGVGHRSGSVEGCHKLLAERNGGEIKRLWAPEMLRLNQVQGLPAWWIWPYLNNLTSHSPWFYVSLVLRWVSCTLPDFRGEIKSPLPEPLLWTRCSLCASVTHNPMWVARAKRGDEFSADDL